MHTGTVPHRLRAIVLILGPLLAVATARADEEIQTVVLPHRPYDACIDPITGAVAVVYPQLDSVALYPKLTTGTAEGAITVKVPQLPVGIAYKRVGTRSMFVVACHGANSVVALDAATLAQLKLIAVSVPGPSTIATSRDPADPYAWYCGGRGHDSRTARVNLATFTDEGVLQGGGHESVMDMAVSATGTLVYLRGPWSPSGRYCMEVVPPARPGDATTLRQLSHEHESVGRYVPDETGELCATGPRLFDATLRRELATLPVAPSLFLPDRPFCLGNHGSNLVAVSLNTYREAGRLYLPIKLPSARDDREDVLRIGDASGQGDFKSFAYRPRMFYDPTTKAVVVVANDVACVVPLAALALPDEPFLSVELEAVGVLAPGRAVRLALRRRDARAAIALRTGPEGLTLDGDTLVWTPTEKQVGEHKVELSLSHGDVEKPFTFALQVTLPRIALGFAVGMLAVSADGRYALAASQERRDRDEQVGPQLASIDLIAGKVLSTIVLPAVPRTIAVDAEHAYVGPSDSDSILVLTLADLGEVKRVYTNGSVARLVVAGSRVLAFTRSGVDVFTRGRDLTPSTLAALDFGQRDPMDAADRGDVGVTWLDGDRALIGGMVYDGACERALEIVQLRDFVTVSFGRHGLEGPAGNRLAWGVALRHDGLRRPGNQMISRFEARTSTLLLDRPALASLSLTDRGQTPSERGEIVLRDLELGSPRVVLPLYSRAAAESRYERAEPVLVARPGHVIVSVGKEVYVVALPKLDSAIFKEPFRCTPTVGLAVIDETTPTLTVPLACTGHTPPLRYSLGGERAGFRVVGDTVELASAAVFELAMAQLRQFRAEAPGEERAVAARDDYVAVTRPRFRELTGRDPRGVPVLLRCGLRVLDGANRATEASFSVLVDVPMSRFANEPAPAAGSDAAPPLDSDAALRKRIAELEAKVRELEEALARERSR